MRITGEQGSRGRASVVALVLAAMTMGACAGDREPRAGSWEPDAVSWPSYRDVPHRICMFETNTYECARAVEAYQLRHGHDHLARRDSSFVIGLPAGDSVVVRDELGDEFGVGGARYSYLGFLPSPGQHLLEIQYYEGGKYLLLDGRTGHRHEVVSVPRVSPDGRRFTVFSSAMDTYSSSALQIWRIDERGIELEWEFDFADAGGSPEADDAAIDWGPRDVVWEAPDSLRLHLETPGDMEGGKPAGSVTLARRTDGWAFEREPVEVVREHAAPDSVEEDPDS